MTVNRDHARVSQTDDAHRAGGTARPSPREDARLVAALRAGRPGAFAELVADYQSAVYNLAFRLTRDREDARDITQDVFLKAYSGIPRTGELRLWAWLYRVTVNACWDHLRAANRRPRPSEHAEELASARSVDDTERAEMARLFSESLAALPPRQQAALVLKDVHGLDHAGIAEALGISRGSSKVLLFHARHSFRRAYTALAADEAQPAACRLAEQAAASSVGRHLNAAERKSLLRHARTCPDCRKVVDGWETPHAVGLALALPLVAVPHLFGAPAAGAVGTALASAAASGAGAGAVLGAASGGGASAAAASGGAAASAGVSAVAGGATSGGAAAGAAASAPLLGAAASSGATAGATGGIAAKLAGLGAVKAAAVVLAAASVAAYGGAEAYTSHHQRPPHRTPAPAAAGTAASRRSAAAPGTTQAAGTAAAGADTVMAAGSAVAGRPHGKAGSAVGDGRHGKAGTPARLRAWLRERLKTSRGRSPTSARGWRRQWAGLTARAQVQHGPGRRPAGSDLRHYAAAAGVGRAHHEASASLREALGSAGSAVHTRQHVNVHRPGPHVATAVVTLTHTKARASASGKSGKAAGLTASLSAMGRPHARSLTIKPVPAASTDAHAAGGGRAGSHSAGKAPEPRKQPASAHKPRKPASAHKPQKPASAHTSRKQKSSPRSSTRS
jgi:RNA polymerase sigma-70 factor, ECF subfamily